MFETQSLKENFKIFLNVYKKKPIEDNFGGIKIEHAFALYCFLKKIKPKYVIESGVFKGMSTWIIEQALPEAKIFCIEPRINNIVYKSKKANYFTRDITEIDFNFLDKDETLIFFDDHICLSKRLDYLEQNKFRKIIFDDNLPPDVIGYVTPRAIMSENFEKSKIRIPYKYISRLIKNIFLFYFSSSDLKQIKFKNKFIEFERKNYSEKFRQKLINKKKLISNYFEFPPLVAFDYKKKFKKQISRYGLDYSSVLRNIPKPIFENLDQDLLCFGNELSCQYGCICYFEYN